MQNTPRDTAEEPVLLSWEMPARRRRLYRFIAYTAFVIEPVAFVSLFVLANDWWTTLALLVWILGVPLFVLTPLVLTAVGLSDTSTGLRVNLALGHSESVRWAGVRSLRRGLYGFAVLSSDALLVPLYLPVPPDVRGKLIAILREASNARIVGFEPEAG